MNFFNAAPIGSIPNNAMYVKSNVSSDSNDGKASDWKVVFDDEARKVNPLFDVGMQRNELILTSIQEDDWSLYNKFQAKQHPAWYEQIDGEAVPNKIYYGNLIQTRMDGLENALAAGDQEAVAAWRHSLENGLEKFKQAPGIVPYVVGLNHNERTASRYGVEQPADDYYDSVYNDPALLSTGKFSDNMWYENALFQEDLALRAHVEELVDGIFPTSESFKEEQEATPVTEKYTEIPIGDSFQAGVMQTFNNAIQQKTSDLIAEEVAKKADKENEKQVTDSIGNIAMATTETQGRVETEVIKSTRTNEKSSFDIQEALRESLRNVQTEPNIIEALKKYESA